jgi:hypothetical protein
MLIMKSLRLTFASVPDFVDDDCRVQRLLSALADQRNKARTKI